MLMNKRDELLVGRTVQATLEALIDRAETFEDRRVVEFLKGYLAAVTYSINDED